MPWVVGLALAASCGGGEERRRESAPPPTTAPPAEATLLTQTGTLGEGAPEDGRGRYARFFVDVAADDRLVVSLTSTAFDPVLEVTPPGSGALINDDWQGDTTRSQLELIASQAGPMRVDVRSYRREGAGAYQLSVRRVASGAPAVAGGASAPMLSAGQTAEGELSASDHTLTGGEVFDSYVVRADGPIRIAVSLQGAEAARTTLVGPQGLPLEASQGAYEAPDPGTYRLQVIGRPGQRYRVAVTGGAGGSPAFARAHHRFNDLLGRFGGAGGANEPPPAAGGPASTPGPLPLRVGDRLEGNLSASDPQLPSGEHYDLYELAVAAPAGEVSIELESSAFDTFLRVEGPGGQRWENDDFGGTLDSRVEVPLTQPGTYRVVATSYRAGVTGPYQLNVLARRESVDTTPSPAQAEQRFEGQLRPDDTTLESGEYVDEHRFTWPVGARIHLEAQSSDFDTYLIVRPPSGPQIDNDDMVPGQTLNAGLDLQVDQPGEYRVLVTSYRPGMTGDYVLVVTGAEPGVGAAPAPTPGPTPTPAPTGPGARTITGTLAQGDTTLRSGEFADTHTVSLTPRSAAQIRLSSSDFDPYLIVRSPSGHQDDNDDFAPGSLESGVDIPVAEPGTYQVTVTSYRPSETGRYTLTITEGQSVVGPAPSTPRPDGSAPPAAGGGRVWGLFAGITDYPGNDNDLPECANDARKLAEAIRNQGNMPADQEFLFTDAQATAANLRQAMQTIASRVRPDDVVVFFFSGHGGQTDTSRDPRELDGRDEYLVAYDGNIMDDELGQLFDRIQARVALVAIDSCFAGGFGKDIITRPGRVGMFSSEEDVTSAVADRFQAGGYLSHFLRLGIQGEADSDPRNGILTVGELTHYTWVQFGRHASDVRMSMGYQHLVVDRGAVRTSEVLWAVSR